MRTAERSIAFTRPTAPGPSGTPEDSERAVISEAFVRRVEQSASDVLAIRRDGCFLITDVVCAE